MADNWQVIAITVRMWWPGRWWRNHVKEAWWRGRERENLSLYDQAIFDTFFKWRQPPMENDLKILKVEYLSNHWSDLPQLLNLSLEDKTKIKNCCTWIQPPLEDNLKILKVKYLRNLLIGSYSNLKLKLQLNTIVIKQKTFKNFCW